MLSGERPNRCIVGTLKSDVADMRRVGKVGLDGRKEAMGSVMGLWSETEPEKASAWLVTQPTGASKDTGIVTLANSQVKSDPEAALTWAATINDPTTRALQLKANVRQWARRDAPAATQWVGSSPELTPEERTELMPAPKP